ncbi:MAG: DNA gyrase subunit A, partial [Anaerolineae bacterium]|nr:DNA gyrase subunit A [Anaerolineae bacterium]
NFGSVDGDSAAAMRYTEARMTAIGQSLLVDLERDTVDFRENFDGSLTEPVVLPSAFPNLLVNGASGIAVGMSTSIPPHNLGEVCDALIHMLEKEGGADNISLTDLMRFIKGPDFPTGGIVFRHSDNVREDDDILMAAYATGRGKIVVRARVHVEEMGHGKSRIIVSELPYQTNKSTLTERIAALVRNGRLEGLADLRDESDRQGLRLVIELQRNADARAVLAELYRVTPLQETFSIIMLALVDDEPRVLSLKQALTVYLQHRQEIVRRRSEHELAQARNRAHVLEGLLRALDMLDETLKIIRSSRTAESARNNLCRKLKITEIQARAILDMQLRQLAALERRKLREEHGELLKRIEWLQGLLGSEHKMRALIADELREVRDTYQDPRRTLIGAGQANGKEDLELPASVTWLSMTVGKSLARSHEDRPPKVSASDRDPPRFLVQGNTTQVLYVFSATGLCASLPVQQLPASEDPAAGAPLRSLCAMGEDAEIVALVALNPADEAGSLLLATAAGLVKRIRIRDLPGVTADAFSVIKLASKDSLLQVLSTDGAQEVLLASSGSRAIRFDENDVRHTGLAAGAVFGMRLFESKERVIGAMLVRNGQYVWSITDDGLAQCVLADEFPTQGRGGKGVWLTRLPQGSRELAAATAGRQQDNLLVLTNRNKARYMRLGLAPRLRRGQAGSDYILSLRARERVAAVVPYQREVMPVRPVAQAPDP